MATIYADRTRLDGGYHLGFRDGTFAMVGDYAANSAALDPGMLAGVTGPLAAAAKTPIGPVATSIGNAVSRTARHFDATGKIRVVNFPGGGGRAHQRSRHPWARPAPARASSAAAASLITGRSMALRIDGNIEMTGGGLPTGQVRLRQPRAGAPMSGVAEIAPYAAKGRGWR